MLRTSLSVLFSIWVSALWAQCGGEDLIAAMPDQDRASLYERSDAVPHPNGILWEATRGDQTIYLVGTMHIYEPRHAATLAQISPWIERAETVLLELGEGDEARMNALVTSNPSLSYITEGPTLIDLLGPEDWPKLKTAMSERGVPGFLTAKMQPWTVLVTLGLSRCVLTQIQTGQRGLDHDIMAAAREAGKPAEALEPFSTAVQLFSEFTQGEMLEFLRLMIRQVDFDPDDQMKTMVEAYFREDVRVLWEFGLQQSLANPQGWSDDRIMSEYRRLEEILINRRNRGWIPVILRAAERGDVLVAAGALHLPGEEGVLALLEREGFAISRIERHSD